MKKMTLKVHGDIARLKASSIVDDHSVRRKSLSHRIRDWFRPKQYYFYDWTNSTTNDPDGLHWGEGCQVFINGEDVTDLYVRRCQTGPNGYVDVLVFDEKNDVVLDENNQPVHKRIKGQVKMTYQG